MKAIYKFPLLAILLIISLAGGCGKDEGSPAAPEEITPLTIEGKIKNWSFGADKYIIFGTNPYVKPLSIYGKAKVNLDGSFSLTLDEPSAENLKKYESPCREGLIVSDTSAKLTSAIMYVADETSVLSEVYRRNSATPGESGFISSEYYYADKPFTVTGVHDCSENYIIEYNINYKAGWNTVLFFSDEKINNVYYARVQMADSENQQSVSFQLNEAGLALK